MAPSPPASFSSPAAVKKTELARTKKEVRPELEEIVRERVDSLWEAGVSGADLVIAAVGAGLRAFTRFARVEYANGNEVPADKFISEVEGVVLERVLEKISITAKGKEAGQPRNSPAWMRKHGSIFSGATPIATPNWTRERRLSLRIHKGLSWMDRAGYRTVRGHS